MPCRRSGLGRWTPSFAPSGRGRGGCARPGETDNRLRRGRKQVELVDELLEQVDVADGEVYVGLKAYGGLRNWNGDVALDAVHMHGLALDCGDDVLLLALDSFLELKSPPITQCRVVE